MNRFLWPLIGFIVLVVLLAVGLNLDPREVPSPLVGKPAPAFSLSKLGSDEKFSPQDMQGKVWLLNVWSTWCVSCRQEHPMLVQMEKTMATQRASAWLQRHGNPYALSALDLDGRVGIDYGVYGVPETYVIDKAGIIRLKHTGPITPEVFSSKLLPLVKELNR